MDLLWAVRQLTEKAVFAAHDGFATGSTKEPAKAMEEASKDQSPAAVNESSSRGEHLLEASLGLDLPFSSIFFLLPCYCVLDC